MNHQYGSLDPPCFADRLRQLNDNLQAMAVRLKDAIAGAVSTMIGQAIRDVVRRMLGDPEEPRREPDRFDNRFDRDSQSSYGGWHDRWGDDERDPWRDDERDPSQPSHATGSRLTDALRTTLQTALWWLRTQPSRRPVLATTLVALTAGGAALFAGPTLAACVSIVASIASLLLTADSVRTAGEMAGAAN